VRRDVWSMNQQSLFHIHQEDLVSPIAPERATRTGEALKREGMQRASEAKAPAVAVAREIALDVSRGVLPHADGKCRADGYCNADDVAMNWPEEAEPLGNAAGSIFTDGNWLDLGYVKSTRPHAHGNPIKQWRRKYA
jgi:hypothetical protein